jgi:hypothetical protein
MPADRFKDEQCRFMVGFAKISFFERHTPKLREELSAQSQEAAMPETLPA